MMASAKPDPREARRSSVPAWTRVDKETRTISDRLWELVDVGLLRHWNLRTHVSVVSGRRYREWLLVYENGRRERLRIAEMRAFLDQHAERRPDAAEVV